MTGGDCGLKRIRTVHSAELFRLLECGQTATDEEVIPQRAVLIEEQDRLSQGADPSLGARGLNLHERDEAMDLGFLRNELGQDTPETRRILAEGFHGSRALASMASWQSRTMGRTCRASAP